MILDPIKAVRARQNLGILGTKITSA